MHRTGIAVIAAAALVLSACGGGGGDDKESESPAAPVSQVEPTGPAAPNGEGTSGAEATKTDAAELRSGLTYLLTEHVFRAATAIKQAADKKGNMQDPFVQAAVKVLDDNSVELSKAVGSAYPDAEAPFLDSWRQHIGFFVDYALGKATNDTAKVDKARTDLDGYRSSFGQLINSVVPELPANAVADELTPHVSTLFSTIDSIITDDGKQFSKIVEAASHMPMTAQALAGGIAKNKGMSGDPNSPASELRAGLTYLLTSHVDLAGFALAQAVAKNGNMKDPSVVAAVEAVDVNSIALSKAVGSAYPDAEAPFLDSWRQHIGFFANYAVGRATKNEAMVTQASTDLDGYRSSFGQLLNSVIPELPAEAVADELKPHVATLFQTIDSQAARDKQVFDNLAEAASHMPMTAGAIAGGIAANKGLI